MLFDFNRVSNRDIHSFCGYDQLFIACSVDKVSIKEDLSRDLGLTDICRRTRFVKQSKD